MLNKKSSLMKRYEASYETKEVGGVGKKGVFDWHKIDGVKFFKPAEGKNAINIIPYEIKTKNHPLVRSGDFEIGDKDYVLDYWVHRNVGPAENTVLCLKKMFGKPCPVCEQQALFNKQGKEDEAKALKPQRKVIYNVEDLKEPGVLKVFDTSHYLFEKELIDEARDDDEGGFVDFADPAEGKTVKFRGTETSFGGRKYLEFKSFSFADRDEPLSDELQKNAISFDEILIVPTYDEVKNILFGGGDDDEGSGKPGKSDDDDSEDDTAKTMSRSDEATEPEPQPKAETKKMAEEAVDDEPVEAQPQPSPAEKKACGDCPFSHKFGKDTDLYPDCDDCDKWESCIKASE